MKLKSNRSYEALARRVGASSSSLHRYCRGVTVPSDYNVVNRFVRACGATEEETAELLRSWVLATGPEVPARTLEPAPVLRRPPGFVVLALLLAFVAYLARRSVSAARRWPASRAADRSGPR
jgi:hypothetical protein